jgi:hypothetical protein
MHQYLVASNRWHQPSPANHPCKYFFPKSEIFFEHFPNTAVDWHLACDGKRASTSRVAGSDLVKTAAWKSTVHDRQDGDLPSLDAHALLGRGRDVQYCLLCVLPEDGGGLGRNQPLIALKPAEFTDKILKISDLSVPQWVSGSMGESSRNFAMSGRFGAK